jgi:hypothetical protein
LGMLLDRVGGSLMWPRRHRVPALRIERLCERWCEMADIEQTLRDWVRATEKLTLKKDLGLLTMLPWAKLIDLSSVYRYLRAWCPSCYEQWAADAKPIYEPLVWNIREATLCPQHLRPLRQVCNHCQRSQHVICKSSRAGYCARCGGWLGASEAIDDLPEGIDLERQRWIALNIGELVSAIAQSPLQINQSQVTMHLATLERSNPRLFYKWPIDEVRSYINGQRSPSLSFLLDICWELRIGLLGFLTSGTAERRR